MPNPITKLNWCKARLGEDFNWWVHEISDPIRWDVDGLGIIDPRQFQHIVELMDPLQDYGLRNEIVDEAFYSFGIDDVEKDKTVLLKRVEDSVLESEEQLFALPDILDDDKGPYADLLDHITRLRIKMLNDVIDFSQSLTIEELEEDIREKQNADYMEGRASHFFTELTAILEYVPEGFALDDDDEDEPESEDDKLKKDLGDIEADEPDEKIEEDDTMKWDEEEEEEEDDDDDLEEASAPPEDEDEDEDEDNPEEK